MWIGDKTTEYLYLSVAESGHVFQLLNIIFYYETHCHLHFSQLGKQITY